MSGVIRVAAINTPSVKSSWRSPSTGPCDAPSGVAEALHGLLAWERDGILALFDDWAQILVACAPTARQRQDDVRPAHLRGTSKPAVLRS